MMRYLTGLVLSMTLLGASSSTGQVAPTQYVEIILPATTTLTLSTSAAVVSEGQSPVLSANVAVPGGGIASGQVTFTVGTGSGAVATQTVAVTPQGAASWNPSLAAGSYTVFAAYTGDPNILNATSAAIAETVLGPQDFAISGGAVAVDQGQSVTVPIKIIYDNGFSGTIAFTCVSPLTTLTCNLNPQSVTLTAPAVITPGLSTAAGPLLSIQTMLTTVKRAGAFGIFFLLFPLPWTMRRRSRLIAAAAMAMLLCAVGCGGSPSYLQVDGTPKGTYTVAVTATAGKLSHTQNVTVTVR